ncbi:unnamed protein product [Microthlaspi erraticum]|uniref:Uncharacterized protein n=1 Tax=Microthlaspi erraticum TaxID=1685480 RepID=A0A6D2K3B3_9BRAS|nr:unnamed protein product [Microthlaspi erraticum]
MFCGFFKPKFYKKGKSSIKYIKIRLEFMRKKRNAMVYYLKTDIVEILNKTGHEHDDIAYRKVEELLEELRIVSSYDLIERFCGCISSNLSSMQKQRECPEECREAVSSLIYAAARVHRFPELKDLRALLTRRYGNSIDDSSVNQELVENLVWRKPSREVKIQKLEEIAQESDIRWDSLSLQLKQLEHTSALQIEQNETSKVEKRANLETEKIITYEQSEDESVLSQSLGRDSFSEGRLSSSSSSSSSSRRRESVQKKKILPYGVISSPYTKPEPRNDEEGQEESKEKMKSIDQESSRLLGPQVRESLTNTSNNEASTTREKERTSLFQRPKLLDYDEVVDRLAALRRS